MPPGQMTGLQRPGLRAPPPSALSEAGSPASQVVRNWVFSVGSQGKNWGVAVHPHMCAPCVCRQTQSNTQTQGPAHGHKNTPRHFCTPVFMAEACVHTYTCTHAEPASVHAAVRGPEHRRTHGDPSPHRHTRGLGEGQPGALPAHTSPSSSWALLLQFLHLFYSPFYRQRLSKHFRLVY